MYLDLERHGAAHAMMHDSSCTARGRSLLKSARQWAEALRLFKKADRIYSDNRSKGAIRKVEELLEEQERKLAEEKKEKEIQRQKYLNMTDDDRQLGMCFYHEFEVMKNS